MPVKRRKAKGKAHRITREAVAAFRKMEDATSDDARADAHFALHQALGLSPWQWPAVLDPADECPYPDGRHAARHWHASRAERPEAFELYEALVTAAWRVKKMPQPASERGRQLATERQRSAEVSWTSR